MSFFRKYRSAFISYALLLALLFALKLHYSEATVDQLRWILEPTARIISVIRSSAYVFYSGQGYFSSVDLVAIVKGCAGVNYFILLLALITLPRVYKRESFRKQLLLIGKALIFAYIITVVINTLRIYLSIFLFDLDIYGGFITKDGVHSVVGISIYFASLLFFSQVSEWLFGGSAPSVSMHISRGKLSGGISSVMLQESWHFFVPFMLYITMTLVVPLINRGVVFDHHFWMHQLLVVGMALAITTVFVVLNFGSRRR